MTVIQSAKRKQENEQDFLEILLKTYLTEIGKSTQRDRSSISMNEKATETFNGNQEDYAQILMTLHSYFDLNKDYRDGVEFEAFPTLGDAYEYIAIQTMIRDGLIEVDDL